MTKAATARSSRTPFRNVYIWLALLIPATLLAFAKSYFGGVTVSGKSVTALIQVHTGLMVLWLLMLIAELPAPTSALFCPSSRHLTCFSRGLEPVAAPSRGPGQ